MRVRLATADDIPQIARVQVDKRRTILYGGTARMCLLRVVGRQAVWIRTVEFGGCGWDAIRHLVGLEE